eukprot:3904701-Prymnesium_polylepis.1
MDVLEARRAVRAHERQPLGPRLRHRLCRPFACSLLLALLLALLGDSRLPLALLLHLPLLLAQRVPLRIAVV